MSECNTNTCTEKKSCGSTDKPRSDKACPIECAVDRWSASFCEAMRQTQVEILKEKIKATWGPTFDKEADAVIATMGVCWESTLKKAKSECELREAFKNIYSETLS